MERSQRKVRTFAMVATAAALGIAAARAEAQVSCGDVVGPNQTVTLEGEVGPCPPGVAAITVVGPATLDLNGFAVTCLPSGAATPTGIVVVGKRATVRDGSVQDCGTGMEVRGEGSHRIERVTVALSDSGPTGGQGTGFHVESHANRLTGNAAVQNRARGFRIVLADRNRLLDNVSFFNGRAGFEIAIGARNVLQRNRAAQNGEAGFHLDAGAFIGQGARNQLKENEARENAVGFLIDGGDSTRLTGNAATANEGEGFFLVFQRRARLTGNRAEDNGQSGIVLGSCQDTSVTRSRALNNDRADDGMRSFDLLESIEGCGSNRWHANAFVTRNQECIR